MNPQTLILYRSMTFILIYSGSEKFVIRNFGRSLGAQVHPIFEVSPLDGSRWFAEWLVFEVRVCRGREKR